MEERKEKERGAKWISELPSGELKVGKERKREKKKNMGEKIRLYTCPILTGPFEFENLQIVDQPLRFFQTLENNTLTPNFKVLSHFSTPKL